MSRILRSVVVWASAMFLACAVLLVAGTESVAALSLAENPFLQQAKLTASGVSELAEQGSSVAISANGDTALVGALAYNNFKGAAWVYVREGSTWTQQAKLVGSEATGFTQQGLSVAISADGNTATVGGPGQEGTGAAWVFTRTGTTWTQQAKLIGTGASGDAEQGDAVALSADGNTVLVGGYKNEAGLGAVWVLTRSGSTWTQRAKLVGAGASGVVEEGTSVALSGDGDTALIGGPRAEGSIKEEGDAWVFTWNGTTWSEQAKLPAGTGVTEQTGQGQSVALSGDGSTALVGGPGYDKALGAAWVYVRSGSTWTQQGEKLLGEDAVTEPEVGHAVSLSESGNTALLGGYHDNTSVGAAWAFSRAGSAWSEQQKLVGTGSLGGFPTQGSSVALSADGGTALVGGAGDNGEVGAAWVFARTPESSEKEPEPEPKKKEEPNPNPSSGGGQNGPTGGSGSSTANTATATSSGATASTGQPTPAELEEKLATAFGFPSAKACYSKRSFKIHIRQPAGYPKLISAEVFLGKRRERSLSKKGLVDQVVLTGLPRGTFTIKIVARTVKGTTLTGSRTYHTCRSKSHHG